MAGTENTLRGDTISVLDHGFVRLVDYMGTDDRIVEAARVEPRFEEGEKLIRYMSRNRHTSPFEKVRFEFHARMPIFVARQWVRHRTGSFNEVSARYTELPDDFYIPSEENITKQADTNKQGRTDEQVDDPGCAQDDIRYASVAAYEKYQRLLRRGVARELARIVLPLNIYTEWYWGIDLHNLFNFLRLRMDSHAQWEMQQYAKAIYELAKPVAPLAFKYWEETLAK